MSKIGERVAALRNADENTVFIYGFGVYEGDEIPVGAAGMMAEALVANGIPNPKIKLDNGKYVFGCECWWGPESSVHEKVVRGRTVVEVDIDEDRKVCEQVKEVTSN